MASRHPDIPAGAIDTELLNLAANREGDNLGSPQPTADLTEIDAGCVARPEQFNTPAVSGLTVPVMFDGGGQVVTRWRTYLRWADGRREVIDAPERLPLPGGSSLILRPKPAEPDGSDPSGWSADARRAWLAGAAAPNPAAVFGRVCERIAMYLDFPPEAAAGTTAAVALWVMLIYVFRAWDAIPSLYVGGPMGSGKARLLDVIARLAFRPLSSSNPTAPALFRTLHDRGGTLISDEAERLRQHPPEVVETNSMLLAGYKRSGRAARLEPVGDSYRTVSFDVYGPTAVACIVGLPPTLASRCVPILVFRGPADPPEPTRRPDADPGARLAIRDDLHALALETGPAMVGLANASGVVPAGVSGRNYELWQPVLALAKFVQDGGADGPFGLAQDYAVRPVAEARDDAVPEADEVLLELLAKAVRDGRHPTPGDLLADARRVDEVAFKSWPPATVSRTLTSNGIARPRMSNGDRRYRDVSSDILRRIGERNGIDLGLSGGRP
jgi:hypothetical protein